MAPRTTIAELAAQYCQDDPMLGRLETREGQWGIVFLDEHEFIPFAELGYHHDFGFFRLGNLAGVESQVPRFRTDYSREELIALCEQAVVPQDKWCNRDSAGCQEQVGHLWAMLKAGCAYQIDTEGEFPSDEQTLT